MSCNLTLPLSTPPPEVPLGSPAPRNRTLGDSEVASEEDYFRGHFREHFRGRRTLPGAGFSLVEIMVVLVIIGLLASAVTINVRGHMVRAKQNTARMEIATICNAIDTFYTIQSRYPSNEEGLAILASSVGQNEPLLKRIPVDPWGRPYEYIQPGKNNPYDVMCLGADGREGGDGADQDVTSDNLSRRSQDTHAN